MIVFPFLLPLKPEGKDFLGIKTYDSFVDIPTFDTNEYKKTIRVNIMDDDESESIEEFTLNLLRDGDFTLPNVVLSANKTTILIQDDDGT